MIGSCHSPSPLSRRRSELIYLRTATPPARRRSRNFSTQLPPLICVIWSFYVPLSTITNLSPTANQSGGSFIFKEPNNRQNKHMVSWGGRGRSRTGCAQGDLVSYKSQVKSITYQVKTHTYWENTHGRTHPQIYYSCWLDVFFQADCWVELQWGLACRSRPTPHI